MIIYQPLSREKSGRRVCMADNVHWAVRFKRFYLFWATVHIRSKDRICFLTFNHEYNYLFEILTVHAGFPLN